MEERIKLFLERNISKEPYDLLRFSVLESYPILKIDFSKVSSILIERAKKDLERFDTIQINRLSANHPLVGDYIRRKDGRLTKIGFIINDLLQDTTGGSFHVSLSGYGSYSGGFTMDILNVNCLEKTVDVKPLLCWTFSNGYAGGNRGVYEYINVRVWKEAYSIGILNP